MHVNYFFILIIEVNMKKYFDLNKCYTYIYIFFFSNQLIEITLEKL